MARKRKQPPSTAAVTLTPSDIRAEIKSKRKKVDADVPAKITSETSNSLTVMDNLASNGAMADKTSNARRNKEKVLILGSRGITSRYRHLMEDIMSLLPHSKKDVKIEQGNDNRAAMLNEMAELKGCTSCIFFETKKRQDLYFWIAKTPNGPSAKFLVDTVHTMAELKLTGNHLKGSRPILTFSKEFDLSPHWQLLKEMFIQVFGTPKDHRKSKPFFDHVIAVAILDGHIWFRNYQIAHPNPGSTDFDKSVLDKLTLVEVGPRFCLNPVKIFGGSFGGSTLYENPAYVSPNSVRSKEKRQKAGKYVMKIKAKARRKQHLKANPMEVDELADMWKE